MIELNLPADTKAILLLCGYFGGKDRDVQPLSLTEYNKLAAWLRREKLRPEDLLSQEGEERLKTYVNGKVNPDRLHRLLERGVELGFAVEQWTRRGFWVVSRGEDLYPRRLKKRLREAAPPLLFGAGDRSLLDTVGLGVVGSRKADDPALEFTHMIGQRCGKEGITVVSGGARGVDQESTLAALGAGGNVIVVLAEGIARSAISKQNRPFISDGRLVLISTYHPDARWAIGNAMGRNRYIYAFSDWTLVVSSGTDGGTWAGAVENLKNRWVPLLVRMDESVPEGNKKLVEMGATELRPDVLHQTPSLLAYLRELADLSVSGNGTGDLFATSETQPPETVQPASLDEERDENTVSEPIVSGRSGTQVAARSNFEVESVEPEIGDLFHVVWPSLVLAFRDEVADSDLAGIAERFHVQAGQLKVWVKKAVDRNLLEKRTRPTRYVIR